MPDATITSTASTFGTISGTFAADQSTITGTIAGVVDGTLTGSVGVPGPQGATGATGPQGPQGDPGQGVPVGGTTGQYLTKSSGTNYDTSWTTLSLSGYATESWVTTQLGSYLPKAGGYITGDINSNNNSAYRSYNGTYKTSTLNSEYLQLNNSGSGGYALTVEWDGITFQSGKQTVHYPGASILTGYATESWVTAGFYPLSGNPSGFLTSSALTPYLLSSTAASTYAPIATGMPSAGTTGQVLTKNSGTNYDAAWTTIVPGDRYLTTSTTSLSIGNGTKTLTVGTGLSYSTQQDVVIAYDASNHMHAIVTSYTSGTGVLVVDVQHHTGSGTYASWTVNVGGTTPLQTLAWGSITGTLSAQTDLQSALDAKLSTATAASTYQTLSGMSSYLTTASAASTYYLQTNPAGYITDAPSDGSQYARKDGAWDVVTPATNYITSVSSPLSVSTGNLSVDLTGYATETWVGTQGFLDTSGVMALLAPYAEINNPTFTGTPAGPTAAFDTNTTQLATTAYVINQGYIKASDANATYAPKASPSLTGTPLSTTAAVDTNTTQIATTAYVVGQGYLKSATASSTYAPLASPALTGTPTSTTAAVNTNTTQIATTAFVLGQSAANSDAILGTSSTKFLNASVLGGILTHPELRPLNYFTNTAVSGSGAVTAGTIAYGSREMYLGSLATGRAAWQYGIPGVNANLWSRSDWRVLNFSKKIWMSGKAMCGSSTSFGSDYKGDANTYTRITLGGYNNAGTGDMTMKGIGWKKQGGFSPYFTLTVHNGTALTDVATTVQQSDNKSIDWVIYSDGTGNVTLYIDGVQAATTSAGPTGTTSNYANAYREQVEATATPTIRQILESTGGWLYIEG